MLSVVMLSVVMLSTFVHRSNIQGRGLFCKRPIEATEMVIEYTGTTIRPILTDKREKYYENKVSTVIIQL